MSRPRWSVPSQNWPEGRARVWVASVAMGSWMARKSAKMAVTTIKSIRKPPAAPSGFFRQKRQRTATTRARGSPTPTGAVSSIPSAVTIERLFAIAHPWIEPAVEHIHEQVREDHHDGDEHDQVLNDWVVPPEDRLDEEVWEARQVENPLGDDESADEERELDPDDCDHRQHRILERVTPDDHPSPLPLGPRRPDVVLSHHLQ